MPSLPASGYIENASRTVAEMKTALESVRDMASVLPGGGARTELTIASGTVTPATRDHGGHFTIDTEGDAASDDLDTITYTNLPNGSIIRVYAENASRVVTLKHGNGGAGEMLLQDATDFEFGSLDQWVEFQRVGTSWEEIDRFVPVDTLATLDESTIADADLFYVFDDGAGVMKAITRANLVQAVAGMVPVASLTASSSSSLDFDANTYPSLFDGTFKGVVFKLGAIVPASDDVTLIMRVGTGATPTWQSGAAAYVYGGRVQGNNSGADLGSGAESFTTGMALSRVGATFGLGTGTGETFSGTVDAMRLGRAEQVQFAWQTQYKNADGNAHRISGGGYYGSTTAITGVRFILSSGNIASGVISAYGLR